MSLSLRVEAAALIAAATVGDGVFALPFVFARAGWAVAIVYLTVLGGMVVLAHTAYLETLEREGEHERLLGLARRYLGRAGFWFGFVAIVFGLLLTLVAYLILGARFIQLGFPAVPPAAAYIAFWLFLAFAVLASDIRIAELELGGIAAATASIVVLFAVIIRHADFHGIPAASAQNLFLPFGAVLFSLAGWTGVEPAYELRKRSGMEEPRESSHRFGARVSLGVSLAAGTALAAFLYALFSAGVIGVAGAAGKVAGDTISGLGAWPAWERGLVAVLGLLVIATTAAPISREVRNALEGDLGWNTRTTRTIIVLFPIVCVAAGVRNFLGLVSVIGAVFLGAQYFLISVVGRRALPLPWFRARLLDAAALLFAAAAVYELVGFIVK